MKICFVGLENLPVLAPEYSQHGIGGEQVQQTLLAKALSRRDYDVSMVVADYGQPDGRAWHGIKTYKAYRFGNGLPVFRFVHPRWTGMWSALKRADADVYYTSCADMLVGLLAMFCRMHARGLVFRLASDTDADPRHLLIKYRRDKVLYRYGLRRANRVLAQHALQRQMLLENYGVRSEVAEMLVDTPCRELSRAKRDISVLWVNNLRDLKRPDLALELARRLPRHDLHMVGGPMQGFAALYEGMRAAATTMPNFTFHGQVPYHDVGDFYDRAKVFVNTSDIEGFPNSYLQSWRRGVPVVAFFDPDGLIRREGLGVVCASMAEMTEAVARLLADEDAWREISGRCRTYMEKMYRDDQVLAPYIKAFAQAANWKVVP